MRAEQVSFVFVVRYNIGPYPEICVRRFRRSRTCSKGRVLPSPAQPGKEAQQFVGCISLELRDLPRKRRKNRASMHLHGSGSTFPMATLAIGNTGGGQRRKTDGPGSRLGGVRDYPLDFSTCAFCNPVEIAQVNIVSHKPRPDGSFAKTTLFFKFLNTYFLA